MNAEALPLADLPRSSVAAGDVAASSLPSSCFMLVTTRMCSSSPTPVSVSLKPSVPLLKFIRVLHLNGGGGETTGGEGRALPKSRTRGPKVADGSLSLDGGRKPRDPGAGGTGRG